MSNDIFSNLFGKPQQKEVNVMNPPRPPEPQKITPSSEELNQLRSELENMKKAFADNKNYLEEDTRKQKAMKILDNNVKETSNSIREFAENVNTRETELTGVIPKRQAGIEVVKWLTKGKFLCIIGIILSFTSVMITLLSKTGGYAIVLISSLFYGIVLIQILNKIKELKLKYNF